MSTVLEVQRHYAPGGMCPPPGGLESGSAWRLVSSAKQFWLQQIYVFVGIAYVIYKAHTIS
ncbi:hypothetical protein DEO72_LG7g1234 [Vigna unguiculata]|uniref:Uncharacterized protein n=1 Tax=Vigna unguiculata TaxID=3917 RepID=A0A4D6MG06_VIGUN|nr:hypothetical protein DEO72_LG7g1234 [Vigna unguiculata]